MSEDNYYEFQLGRVLDASEEVKECEAYYMSRGSVVYCEIRNLDEKYREGFRYWLDVPEKYNSLMKLFQSTKRAPESIIVRVTNGEISFIGNRSTANRKFKKRVLEDCYNKLSLFGIF